MRRRGTNRDTIGIAENSAMGGPMRAGMAAPPRPSMKRKPPKITPANPNSSVRSRVRDVFGSGRSRMARITLRDEMRALVAQTVTALMIRPMRAPVIRLAGSRASRNTKSGSSTAMIDFVAWIIAQPTPMLTTVPAMAAATA